MKNKYTKLTTMLTYWSSFMDKENSFKLSIVATTVSRSTMRTDLKHSCGLNATAAGFSK